MTTRPGAGPTGGGAARFHSPPPASKRGRPAAIASALALIALIGGVPGLLLTLAGPIAVPTHWPTTATLTRSVGIDQVLTVLVCVVWLAWLQFLLCVLVEVAAALRGGVLARPVPFSAPSQRLARALVASVLLAGAVVGQVGAAQAATSASTQNAAAGRAALSAAAPFAVSPAEAARMGSGFSADAAIDRASARSPQAHRGADRMQSPAVQQDGGGSPTSGEAGSGAGAGTSARTSGAGTGSDTHGATHITDDAALSGRKVYVVTAPAGRHHDSLWAIAERHLGDGRRYQEIYRLNENRVQPDGRTLHLARLIQPGWQLIMPNDAVGVTRYVARAATPSRSAGAANSETGTPTETQTETQTGAQSQNEDLNQNQAQNQARNQNLPQPSAIQAVIGSGPVAVTPPAEVDGPSLPSPAQPTHQPTHQAGYQAAPPTHRVAQPTAQPTHQAAQPTRQPTHQAAQSIAAPTQPQASAPATGARSPSGALTAPSSQLAEHRTGQLARPFVSSSNGPRAFGEHREPADASSRGSGLHVPALALELGGGGLLTAALLGTLLAIRRRRGERIERNVENTETEVWLRAGADADRGALLDLALRSLTRSCRDAGRPLPQAYGAVVDDDGLDLLLTMAHPTAPPPWAPAAEGLRWRLTYPDAHHLVADGDSAYPLLASVGRDAQGRDALVNLGAAAGPVAVVGSPAMAAAVVRALALGLAGNPWSRGIEVLTADLPPALPAIAAGRLIPCAGARDLTDQLEAGSGRMPRSGPIQILTGGPAPGSRPERVAVYGAPLNAPIAQRLQALTGRRADLAVLVSGELPGARWRLRVDDAGNLSCDELSLNVTANRLGDGSIERLHALFLSASTSSSRTAAEQDGQDSDVVETDDVTWAQAPVRIALLGDVEVRTLGQIDPARLALAGEIVSYLALHPAGAHPTVLASAIWPKGVTTDVRDATVQEVQEWLGAGVGGAPRLNQGHDGRLRLSCDVPCDWDVLRTLVGRAGQSPDPSRERDLLVRALHLVRGPVVGGITHGTYTWLPRTDLERQAEEQIARAADRLSTICAGQSDQVAASEAATAGLRAVPSAQHLWRHVLRAEHALGGPARLARVVEHLRFALTTSGVDVEPETEALIEHLSRVPAGRAPGDPSRGRSSTPATTRQS